MNVAKPCPNSHEAQGVNPRGESFERAFDLTGHPRGVRTDVFQCNWQEKTLQPPPNRLVRARVSPQTLRLSQGLPLRERSRSPLRGRRDDEL